MYRNDVFDVASSEMIHVSGSVTTVGGLKFDAELVDGAFSPKHTLQSQSSLDGYF